MRRTGSISTSPAAAALALALASASCAAPGQPYPAAAEPAIRGMLERSAEAWTRGDLDGYLDDYADDATFVTSSGLVQGVERIRERYVRGYWGSGTPEHGLRFEDLDIRRKSDDAAIAFGRYVLYDRSSGAAASTGTFSLTLRRGANGWVIVHDHSCADDAG